MLAGGDLEQIIRESVETKEIREIWAHRDFDLAEVRKQLALVDPLTYASRLKGRRVLMFNARQDRSIPPECTRKLWRAMGQPPIHWWNATHYSAIWYLPAAVAQMAEFFDH